MIVPVGVRGSTVPSGSVVAKYHADDGAVVVDVGSAVPPVREHEIVPVGVGERELEADPTLEVTRPGASGKRAVWVATAFECLLNREVRNGDVDAGLDPRWISSRPGAELGLRREGHFCRPCARHYCSPRVIV